MTTRILPLIATCALVSGGSASGALLIGFHNFTVGDTGKQMGGSGTNYLASGFSGFYDPTTGIRKTVTGGSADQTYGNITVDVSTPGVDNGYVETFAGWFPILELANNSGSTVALDKLLYDATSSGATPLSISYRYGTAGGFTDLVTTPLTNTYQSFSHDISSLELNDGQTIQFRFSGDAGGQLDNFGITSVPVTVPEPSTVLIAGGLLGLGALRRRRA